MQFLIGMQRWGNILLDTGNFCAGLLRINIPFPSIIAIMLNYDFEIFWYKKKKQKWQQLSLSVPAPTSGCRIWATSNVTEHHLHNHLIEVCIPLQYDVASPVTCIFTLRENVIVPKRRKLFTQWPASYPRKRNSQPYLSEKFEALNLLKYLVFNVMEYPKITNDRTISPFFIVLVFVFNNPFLNCTIEKLQKLWLLEWNCSGRKCI